MSAQLSADRSTADTTWPGETGDQGGLLGIGVQLSLTGKQTETEGGVVGGQHKGLTASVWRPKGGQHKGLTTSVRCTGGLREANTASVGVLEA